MNESTRTILFVATAAVSLGGALLFGPGTPKAPDEHADVGKPFYADFDPLQATGLKVVTFNDATAAYKEFEVELRDGTWQIVSNLNYPADGKDRLAKTAASVIGIKRIAFQSRNPEDYADLGVVDPLDEDMTKLKGRGERITITGPENATYADYIIGKPVKDNPGYHYVRRPDEKSVYTAKLENLDLSTKFSDWIEADLLQIQGDQLKEVVIEKYSINEAEGRIEGQETTILKRELPADPWKIDGLKEDKEEVNQDEVRKMVGALDDLRIVGVRRKPKGLSEDLKLNEGIQVTRQIMMDLAERGFLVGPNGQLVSKEGEMLAATDQGAVYSLRFGEIFSGSELEIESGVAAKKPAKKEDKKPAAGEKSEKSDSLEQSRYLFVMVQFDDRYLGPKPTPPKAPTAAPAATETPAPKEEPAAKEPAPAEPKPETPATPETPKEEAAPAEAEPSEENNEEAEPTAEEPATEAPAAETPAADQPAKEKPAADTPAAEEATPEKPAAEKPAADTPAEEAPAEDKPATEKPAAEEPAAEEPATEEPAEPTPEEAKAAYEAAKVKYEADLKEYNQKIKDGEARVKELNARFADWFYVISDESFTNLRQGRKTLVKEKAPAKPETETEENPGETPATNPADTPATEDPADEKKPADEKPADEKPADEKPAGDKPETEAPADKPADEKPDSEAPATTPEGTAEPASP